MRNLMDSRDVARANLDNYEVFVNLRWAKSSEPFKQLMLSVRRELIAVLQAIQIKEFNNASDYTFKR